MKIMTLSALLAAVFILPPASVSFPEKAAAASGWVKSYYEIRTGREKIQPEFKKVMERPNGDLVAVGSCKRFRTDPYNYDLDGIVLVTSPAGLARSCWLVGSKSSDEYFNGLIATTDNGFLLCGSAVQDSKTVREWIVKFNASWKIVWQRTFGKPNLSLSALGASQMKGSSYVVVSDEKTDFNEPYLMKISSTGAIQWQKKLLKGQQSFGAVTILGNPLVLPSPAAYNDVTLFGFSFETAFVHPALLKLNGNGSIAWLKRYKIDDGLFQLTIHPRSSILTSDGGYLLGLILDEYSASFASIKNPLALKLTSTGAAKWAVKAEINALTDAIFDMSGAYLSASGGAVMFSSILEPYQDTIMSFLSDGAFQRANAWTYYDKIYASAPSGYALTRQGGQVGVKNDGIWKWDKSGWLSSDCQLKKQTKSATAPTLTEADVTPFPTMPATTLSSAVSKMSSVKIGSANIKVHNDCHSWQSRPRSGRQARSRSAGGA